MADRSAAAMAGPGAAVTAGSVSLVHKLQYRSRVGCMREFRVCGGSRASARVHREKLFGVVPRRLKYPLPCIAPREFLVNSNIVTLGFTADGQHMLVYQRQPCSFDSEDYRFELQWWRFRFRQPLVKERVVRLCDGKGMCADLRLEVLQPSATIVVVLAYPKWATGPRCCWLHRFDTVANTELSISFVAYDLSPSILIDSCTWNHPGWTIAINTEHGVLMFSDAVDGRRVSSDGVVFSEKARASGLMVHDPATHAAARAFVCFDPSAQHEQDQQHEGLCSIKMVCMGTSMPWATCSEPKGSRPCLRYVRFDAEAYLRHVLATVLQPRHPAVGNIANYHIDVLDVDVEHGYTVLWLYAVARQRGRMGVSLPPVPSNLIHMEFVLAVNIITGQVTTLSIRKGLWLLRDSLAAAKSKARWKKMVTLRQRRCSRLTNSAAFKGKPLSFVIHPVFPLAVTL
eukprot:m.397822 g.397822  ORF g.397822 m.397822 type:complete len:456 (-) comp20107_c2_seq18:6608-7975(-)